MDIFGSECSRIQTLEGKNELFKEIDTDLQEDIEEQKQGYEQLTQELRILRKEMTGMKNDISDLKKSSTNSPELVLKASSSGRMSPTFGGLKLQRSSLT